MAKMQCIQVNQPGSFALTERDIPEPGPGQVRIQVKACGICHSDCFTREGQFPGIQFPRIPGHEVAGIIDAVGPDVKAWKVNQPVGVGWAGQQCHTCQACRRGDFILCTNHKITGIHYDGGYAQSMIAPVDALAAIPEKLTFEEAAPLLCAGITTFNALRHSGAKPGDVVAIQGIGGLGHLGVQFAHQMGFMTFALSSGEDKQILAKKLGADYTIDTGKENPAAVLRKHGGARVILCTAPSGKAITPLIEALGPNGKLVIVGASMDLITVSAMQLIGQRKSIAGWPSGTALDSEETLRFCAETGIRAMIETFPLEKAEEAYQHMMSNKARFRCVLKMS